MEYVLFTHESKIELDNDKYRVCVWFRLDVRRNRVEEFFLFQRCLFHYGTGRNLSLRLVHLVYQDTMTNLIYTKDLLMVYYFQTAIGENFNFVDDNALSHLSGIVFERLETLGV